MVNFRFHVVSIIAVFLALAIGTVLGSAFVGRGVIDNLQGRINTVQKAADDTRDRNEHLKSDIDVLTRYTRQTANYAVGRSLAGVRVDLVAERGVDGGAVDAQATLLRQAGATVPGVIWLEPRLKLTSRADQADLRTATGLTNRGVASLRAGAAGVVGRRLAAPPPTGDDVLVALADQKFVTLTGAAGSATPAAAEFSGDARALLIGGPASDLPADVVPALAGGLVDGKAKVAIGEVFVITDTVKNRSDWIDPIASDDALRNVVSTIDDLERIEGQVACTLALAELGAGGHGNYGLARERTVPEKVVTAPLAR